MRILFALVVLLISGSSSAWAYNCPNVQSATTKLTCTEIVFNDTGSAVTSGSVVAWDDDDTDFSTSGYPYVITTTTADDPYTAGVMLTNSCPDQALCEIVTHGLTEVILANSTDDTAVDTQIGNSTVAGQAGDYATGANTCMLGTLVAYENADIAIDGIRARVFVNIDCD